MYAGFAMVPYFKGQGLVADERTGSMDVPEQLHDRCAEFKGIANWSYKNINDVIGEV